MATIPAISTREYRKNLERNERNVEELTAANTAVPDQSASANAPPFLEPFIYSDAGKYGV
jgi:hypothetical protein